METTITANRNDFQFPLNIFEKYLLIVYCPAPHFSQIPQLPSTTIYCTKRNLPKSYSHLRLLGPPDFSLLLTIIIFYILSTELDFLFYSVCYMVGLSTRVGDR